MAKDQVHKLVIVDDDSTLRKIISLNAQKRGIAVSVFESGEEAMQSLNETVEVVLLDLHMPGWDGLQCLEYLREHYPLITPVMLSGSSDIEQAVQAMKKGAFDFITKPFDPNELFATLFKAKQFHELQKENQVLRSFSQPHQTEDVVAESPTAQQLVSMVKKVAPLETSVLLTGESGVGKGLFARMIHRLSQRVDKPLVTVSCPALPRELLESELFGHEKGAFTGATSKRAGKIEAARGGTLFLDEIGELPLDLQPKLLNVLQDGQYYPVGSETPIKSDVRIIAATNIDFAQKIADGSFREDLYYRLSVFPLEISPLRERLSDIPPLVTHILAKINARYRGQKAVTCGRQTIEALQTYRWTGNIRELENALERAWILCDGELLPEHFVELRNTQNQGTSQANGLAGITLKEIEKSAILQTLAMANGNKAKAARLLGITEKTIYNKMARLGIQSPPS